MRFNGFLRQMNLPLPHASEWGVRDQTVKREMMSQGLEKRDTSDAQSG